MLLPGPMLLMVMAKMSATKIVMTVAMIVMTVTVMMMMIDNVGKNE